jgi:hypothetical protein
VVKELKSLRMISIKSTTAMGNTHGHLTCTDRQTLQLVEFRKHASTSETREGDSISK